MEPKNEKSAKQRFPIVGVGASAGGFEALRQLLKAMPDEPGVALVIIQHLAPDRASLAPDLLAKFTSMEVRQVQDEPIVRPNHVYIIPPGYYLSITDGHLQRSKMESRRTTPIAIDSFLRSLAKDQRQCSVGVILSGSGSDGAVGIKAIREAGGMVIAQSPETAQHDSMPQNAIATGVVDHVMAPDQMADVLVEYAKHDYVRQWDDHHDASRQPSKPQADSHDADDAADLAEGLQSGATGGEGSGAELAPILALLHAFGNRDFRKYKEATLRRRTRRRMCLHSIADFDKYQDFLRKNPKELEALAQDLLISVTDFFRDHDAWEELISGAIREIVRDKNNADAPDDPSDPIRVWVPGCATGEEAYSVAISILEELGRQRKTCPLQIFASDIDQSAISIARSGRYSRSIETDVSTQRLDEFFTLVDDNSYQINKVLRDSIVFADQDLIGDPPFSNMDLICCRNVLIYLKPNVQQSIIALFHFALRERGFLMLGTAETVGRQDDLFQPISKRWRIYRGVGPTRHDRLDLPLALGSRTRQIESLVPPAKRDDVFTQIAQKSLLEMAALNAVLVDRHWRILYICGNVDRYLTRSPGVPNDDLLKNARGGLRSKLRVAVHQALSQEETVTTTCRVDIEGQEKWVRVEVQSVRANPNSDVCALILFRDLDDARTLSGEGDSAVVGRNGDDTNLEQEAVIRRLEDELVATKEDLQSTIEQFETSGEEFKASNEEVMSVNEELQSTNEELETSKEELQSLNEELATVNQQLASKVGELEIKHSDLENLISATEIATLCLDPDLMIRWFTPAVQQIGRIRRSDLGRSINDIKLDFVCDDLTGHCEQVLQQRTAIENEVRCHDGRVFVRRVIPYLAENRFFSGLVVTFIEITDRIRREEDLRASRERLRRALDIDGIGVLFFNSANILIDCNNWFLELTGYTREEVQAGKVSSFDLTHTGAAQVDAAPLTRLEQTGHLGPLEHEFRTKNGELVWMMLSGRTMEDQTTVVHCIDISDRKQAEQSLHSSEERLRMANSAARLGWYAYEVETNRSEWSDELRRLHGFEKGDEISFERILEVIHPDDRERFVRHRQQAFESSDAPSYEAEFRILRADGEALWLVDRGRAIFSDDKEPRPLRAIGMVMDVTDRKRAEAELQHLNKTLELQVTRRTEMLGILQYVTRIANEADSVEQTMLRAMERIASINGWIVGHLWTVSDDEERRLNSSGIWHVTKKRNSFDDEAFRRFKELTEQTALLLDNDSGEEMDSGEELIEKVIATGKPEWIEDIKEVGDRWARQAAGVGLHAAIAFPIILEHKVIAVMEFFADHPCAPRQRFIEIMPDIGIQLGHPIGRKRLEKIVADVTSKEQQRIGRELHDGIAQQLTGGALIAETLRQSLAPELVQDVKHASHLVEILKSTHQDVRALSSGLMPSTILASKLAEGLRDLTTEVNSRFAAHCEFCDQRYDSAIVKDDGVAFVIYQVAREAIHNAVKHADAEKIVLEIQSDRHFELTVRDDGQGFDVSQSAGKTNGLMIMKYRADSVGGTLQLQSVPGEGTTVKLIIPRTHADS